MMKLQVSIAVFAGVMQAACATVVRGTTEPFIIETNPPGAMVTTTLETPESWAARQENPERPVQRYGCAPTPCAIELPRRSKFIAKIKKPGFAPVRVTVTSRASLKGQAPSLAGSSVVTGALLAETTASSGSAVVAGLVNPIVISGGVTAIATPMIAVDALSGAMLSLSPNPVVLDLQPDTDTLINPAQLPTLK